MIHTIDETVAIIGDIVLQAATTPGVAAGEVLETLAPGNGRAMAELLFTVACRFGDVAEEAVCAEGWPRSSPVDARTHSLF